MYCRSIFICQVLPSNNKMPLDKIHFTNQFQLVFHFVKKINKKNEMINDYINTTSNEHEIRWCSLLPFIEFCYI